MAYDYSQIEEAANVRALKILLEDASTRAGAVFANDPAEYARMMHEVIAVAGRLAQAYDENARVSRQNQPFQVGQHELVAQLS